MQNLGIRVKLFDSRHGVDQSTYSPGFKLILFLICKPYYLSHPSSSPPPGIELLFASVSLHKGLFLLNTYQEKQMFVSVFPSDTLKLRGNKRDRGRVWLVVNIYDCFGEG